MVTEVLFATSGAEFWHKFWRIWEDLKNENCQHRYQGDTIRQNTTKKDNHNKIGLFFFVFFFDLVGCKTDMRI